MQATAREIHNRGDTHKVISQFWSKRQKTAFWCESIPELEYCYHLELDRSVETYRTQPRTVRYEFAGTWHSHTPDFEVRRRSRTRPLYVNVKPASIASYHEFVAEAEAITRALAREGADHKVVTAEYIAQEPLLSNLKLLYLHSDRLITVEMRDAVLAQMALHHSTTASVVLDWLRPFQGDIGLVWALVAQGRLNCDLMQPLTGDATVSMELTR